MKKVILTMIISVVITLKVFTQSAGDYRSIANGNWNDATKWEVYNGSDWVGATRYPGQDPGTGAVDISAFHDIRLTASVPHPVAALWIQSYYDEYWTYETYFGILSFSGESAVSLTVSGNIYAAGIINVNDQAGSKSHTLFIGGSFNGWLEAINADDNLNVVFNSTFSNTTITGYGTYHDVTFNGNVFTVQGTMFIAGVVAFINGIVSTTGDSDYAPESGLIHFKKGATWSGASNISYVDGWVSKEGDEPFTFPIGENGIYAPLIISAPVGPTEKYVAMYRRASGSDIAGITDPGLFNVSNCEYWSVTSRNNNGPLDITVGWNGLSGCGVPPYIMNVSDITLAHFNGTSWTSHGGVATGTNSNGSVTWSGATGFNSYYNAFTFGNVSACKTPSGLSTTNVTGNSATLRWSPEPGAVSYDVYYDDFPTAPVSFWTNAATGTASTSVNISGLNQSSTYYYRVRANCSSSSSSYRQAEFTTVTVCDRPTGLTTTNITDVSATLSWAPVPGATSYQVEYSQYSVWIPVNTVITSTSYTLGGLSPGTYYYWRVRANCTGSYSHYTYSESFFTYYAFCHDIHEPNNSSNQAETISLGVTISATISSATDEDWFKLMTPNISNTTLQVILSNLPADYDLYVYDKRFKLVGSSTAFGNSIESVIFNSITRKATYYIKVVGKNGAYTESYCYDLLVQVVGSGGSVTRASDPANEITDRSNVQMLYPNPASEFIYLHFKSDIEGMSNVQILNSIGQLVKQHPVNTIKGLNQIKIPVADIRPGMYILRINKGDLNLTRKLMIAR